MLGVLILVLIAVPLWAACPSSGGYNNTCFVATNGSDATGDGTIGNPYQTILKAYQQMAPGDTIQIRGGRYTGSSNRLDQLTLSCTEASPCTIRSHPGEVVILDGSALAASSQVFWSPDLGSQSTTPLAYSDDPKVSHWRFIGLRFENWERWVFWAQSEQNGLEFRSIRIHAKNGINLSTTKGLKIFGSHIAVSGLGYLWTQGSALNCSPVFPSSTSLPWPGMQTPTQSQLRDNPPKWSYVEYGGCRNVIVQDSWFGKDYGTANDVVSFETGRDQLWERVSIAGPKYQDWPQPIANGDWIGKWPAGEPVSSVQTLTSSSQIVKDTNSVLLIRSESDVTLTSTPTISGTITGTIQLVNVGRHTITIQDDNALAGSGLCLGANRNRPIPPGHTQVLLSSGGACWTNSSAATDSLDMKAQNVKLHRLRVSGGKAAIKIWGSVTATNVMASNAPDAGEQAIVQSSPMRTTASDCPASQPGFKPIRAVVDNTAENCITVFSYSLGGTQPVKGQLYQISEVPGCTSANGIFRIRSEIGKNTVCLENLDGSDTSCNAAYDWAAQTTCSGQDTKYWAGKIKEVQYPAGSWQYITAVAPFSAATNFHIYERNDVGVNLADWSWRDSIVAAYRNPHPAGDPNGGSAAHVVSAFTNDSSDRNLYYSGGATPAQAYCAINYTKGGTGDQGSCLASVGDITTYEPNSAVADPVFADYASLNVRATASSPAAFANKGAWAGLHSLVGAASGEVILRNLFPSAEEPVTVTVDDNADFGTPVESFSFTDKGSWRDIVLGKNTPLSPNTTYYYRLEQGYDVVTGSFTTPAATTGMDTISIGVRPPAGLAGVDTAVLETSVDGTTWTSHTPVSCASGCTLTGSVARDRAYYCRWQFRDSQGALLALSKPQAVVVR